MHVSRELPPEVVVQARAGVEDLWDRFELFEALHHTMSIATPMAEADLSRVVDVMNPADGAQVLDVACGYGELLKRLRQTAVIEGVGIDLSPWMMAGAAAQPTPGLCWVLAEARGLFANDGGVSRPETELTDPARAVIENRRWDIVSCLGASWIWYGLHGTIRALADLVEPGALVAVGDMHQRPDCDLRAALETHGRVDSMTEIDEWFDRYGIDLVERVSTSDQDWDTYHDRVDQAAEAWVSDSEQANKRRWLDEAREWRLAAERDRFVLTWSVWVGRKR